MIGFAILCDNCGRLETDWLTAKGYTKRMVKIEAQRVGWRFKGRSVPLAYCPECVKGGVNV